MRRTRENSWQYVLFLVPAIAAGFGIQYLVKKHKGAANSSMVASSNSSNSGDSTKGYREIAHEHDRKDRLDSEGEDRDEDQTGTETAKTNAMTDDQDVPQKDLKRQQTVAEGRDPASTGSSLNSSLNSLGDGQVCSSFELRGDGMSETHFSNEEWTKVMDLFHESKTDLQAWLVTHKSEFPGGLSNWMSQQVENAKIQRPPVSDEPDLSWRGIGVLAHNGSGTDSTPLIRIGGGFVKMVVTQPKRARFELSRLIAQSWNPCDLPTGAMATWEPLLKCMGVKPADWDSTKSCAAGSESEAGWAVASAVAATASPPGCTLPAFKAASTFSCVTKTAWLEQPADATVRVPASISDIKTDTPATTSQNTGTTTGPKTGAMTMLGLGAGTSKTLVAGEGTSGAPYGSATRAAMAAAKTTIGTTAATTAAVTDTTAKTRAPASVKTTTTEGTANQTEQTK
jgi:hypothetical protein